MQSKAHKLSTVAKS